MGNVTLRRTFSARHYSTTLEWQGLPIVGEERRRRERRARFWRTMTALVALFWIALVAAMMGAL